MEEGGDDEGVEREHKQPRAEPVRGQPPHHPQPPREAWLPLAPAVVRCSGRGRVGASAPREVTGVAAAVSPWGHAAAAGRVVFPGNLGEATAKRGGALGLGDLKREACVYEGVVGRLAIGARRVGPYTR